ncbi:uncharacterized protein BJX67DRAFT_76780 [Aspergillus lucknowensis]|uniref:Uncharacterized protein n=1 Tax=Aspergillus lucknowensis TaxID=176173 RepID=A0ABR4LTK0_9EURO
MAAAFRRTTRPASLWNGTKRALKVSAGASLAAAGGWQFWFRHCYFEPFGPETDPLFHSHWLSSFNPGNHPSLNDSCVRKVPLSRLPPELVDDADNGGSRLLERFCAGVWGGYGYAIQRNILTYLWRSTSTQESSLWDKQQLLDNSYEEGTVITDHFVVLSKSPRAIVLRGGGSPGTLNRPGPREIDSISEITVDIHREQGVAEFRLKNIFFNGVERKEKLFPAPVEWLHLQYCRLLVEGGVSVCVQ